MSSEAQAMIARRKRYIATTNSEIADMKRSILVNKTSIANFQTRGSGDAEYNSVRIENASKNIDELLLQIARAEQKIINIEAGALDGEIQKECKRVKDALAKKVEADKLLAESEIASKAAGKVQSKAFYEIERNAKYTERTLEKELAKYWDSLATLPPNILKNIETTPSNRCYKHRGVCFYGKRPEQKPDMIFQKTPEGTVITEVTDTYIATFLKPFNGGNKMLINKSSRRINPGLTAPAILTKM